MEELLAYIGLELATFLHRLNRLRDYWCHSEMMEVPFSNVIMSRDDLLRIRASLRSYATYNLNVALACPLRHSSQLLEDFARNVATLAVLVGVSSLDDSTIRCKGRTAAQTYMKSKPVKFGIRFFAVVGLSHAYLQTFQDNRLGNKYGHKPVQRYTNLSRGIPGAVERKNDGKCVRKCKPSDLWCAQMAYQTQLHPTLGV